MLHLVLILFKLGIAEHHRVGGHWVVEVMVQMMQGLLLRELLRLVLLHFRCSIRVIVELNLRLYCLSDTIVFYFLCVLCFPRMEILDWRDGSQACLLACMHACVLAAHADYVKNKIVLACFICAELVGRGVKRECDADMTDLCRSEGTKPIIRLAVHSGRIFRRRRSRRGISFWEQLRSRNDKHVWQMRILS